MTAMICSLAACGGKNQSSAGTDTSAVGETAENADSSASSEDVVAYQAGTWDGVTYTNAANKELKRIEDLGMGNFPVCMAKTQYSLSDDPKVLGRPEGFEVTVKEIRISAGAGFIVVLLGDVMTMPGLPKKPAALNIDIDDNGNVVGLF